MDTEENNTPICDVFKGDEAFWTEKYSGHKGEVCRARIRGRENMPQEAKEALRLAQSLGQRRYFDNRTPEGAKIRNAAQLHGQINHPEVYRVFRAKKLSESHKNMSEEAKRLRGLRNSESQREHRSRMTEEDLIASSKSHSEARLNLSEEAKKANSLASSKAQKDYLKSLTLEQEIERGLKIAKGHANATPSKKKASIENNREAQLRRWSEASQEQRDTWISKSLKGNKGMTEPERLLKYYLETKLPSEWAYNGQYQLSVVIGGKVPDFVNIRGIKAVIEVMGYYWHPEEHEKARINHYKTFGYECIVIWEYDTYIPAELDKIFRIGENNG